MYGLLRFGLVFLGGAALGAMAATCTARKDGVRPLAAELLSRGMDVKDCVMGKVETLKENVEDLVAEAQHSSEKRREQKEGAEG